MTVFPSAQRSAVAFGVRVTSHEIVQLRDGFHRRAAYLFLLGLQEVVPVFPEEEDLAL